MGYPDCLLHGVDERGTAAPRKQRKRDQMPPFFANTIVGPFVHRLHGSDDAFRGERIHRPPVHAEQALQNLLRMLA